MGTPLHRAGEGFPLSYHREDRDFASFLVGQADEPYGYSVSSSLVLAVDLHSRLSFRVQFYSSLSTVLP